MTFSKYTNRTISTPYQDNGRGGTRVDRIVLHHMASTGFQGVLSMWENATRQGSANYAISNEGEIVGAVPEENRSWSLSNYAFDARSITFEIENESLGGSWPVSAAAHEATARVVADICSRYGIPCDRAHVLTHREVAAMGYSYATACPGGLNADAIVTRANEYLSGTADSLVEEPRKFEDIEMYVRGATNPQVYAVWTDANGRVRMRACGGNEAAFAVAGNLVIRGGDDTTITNLATEAGYPNVPPPNVNATVPPLTPAQIQTIADSISAKITAGATKAEVTSIVNGAVLNLAQDNANQTATIKNLTYKAQ